MIHEIRFLVIWYCQILGNLASTSCILAGPANNSLSEFQNQFFQRGFLIGQAILSLGELGVPVQIHLEKNEILN